MMSAGWACLTRRGWMLAIVDNAGLPLLEATHISLLLRGKETSSIQVACSGQVSCENAFGTSSRNSLLTAKSFTCLCLAFLIGVTTMSVGIICYFCVICFLLALWIKGSALEWYCIPAVITAKKSTYRRFYCAQCEEGLPQWHRQNTEIRTCFY